jgi:transmembrane sensor
MSKIVDISGQASIEQEAAQWVTKLDGSRLPAGEFAIFRTWIEASDLHREAFEKVAAVWGELDSMSVLAEAPEAAAEPVRPSLLAKTFDWLSPKPAFALAGFAALVAISLVSLSPATENFAEPSQFYATETGQSRTVELADGSTVLMNTASQLEVQYTPEKRVLKLQKGEAHFDVASNKDRPFEVHAGANIVRAVGTAFSVELRDGTVEVTVTEGIVELAALSQDAGNHEPQETSLARLSKGQSAEFSDYIQSLETIQNDELERRLAWHKGGLAFEGDKLSDVVAEVSRYTNINIVISDPALRDLLIGGYFKTEAPETMLAALEANFGVEVRWVSDDLVYLSQSLAD